MFLKLSGGVVLLIASACLGWQASHRLLERPRRLQMWRASLTMIRTEIEYGCRPLADVMEAVATRIEDPVRDILRVCAMQLRMGRVTSAEHALRMAFQRTGACLSLPSSERTLLLQLFGNLGTSTVQDQQRHIALALENLRWEEEQVRGKAITTAKLYRTLGWLGGLLLVLALL
ncbi:stage III sporulation protein AB [Pasteuria penetrans]|uniref:stage III sporulation protein AB n=1 Tax=Pasteuria penetrans TaxID=86005 RepID=UPI000F9893E7|nr:stage III sporulation protein AB [Pasteuria penetrans]